MNKTITERGFKYIEFKDYYDNLCSIQESSLATKKCIWLGLNDVKPKIMASNLRRNLTGWVDFPIPDNAQINSRMHLTQEQAKDLIEVLQKFVNTGRL